MKQTRFTRYFGQTLGALFFAMGLSFGINSYLDNAETSRDNEIRASSPAEREDTDKKGLGGIVYAVGGAALFLLSRYGNLDARNKIKDYQPSEEEDQERDTL